MPPALLTPICASPPWRFCGFLRMISVYVSSDQIWSRLIRKQTGQQLYFAAFLNHLPAEVSIVTEAENELLISVLNRQNKCIRTTRYIVLCELV